MAVVLPAPLRPGDRIGVTSPSSGVPQHLWPRFEHAVQSLRDRGYDVVVGDCMDGSGLTSAPKEQRAAELTAMLTDPSIRAVVPPWGGDTAIDLLDQLDWDALARGGAHLDRGLQRHHHLDAAVHAAARLGDAARGEPDGHAVRPARRTPALDRPRRRDRPGHAARRSAATAPALYDDWVGDPTLTTLELDGTGDWSLLEPANAPIDVTGRLVGGCIEVLGPICSTYADVATFGREHADEGLVVYVEESDEDAITTCRMLHAMRYAGWFDHANAVLVGRTLAPDADGMTQHDAVRDALGALDVPVVLDVECGHVAPFLPLVNGALARVVMDDERREVTQDLGR